MEDVFRNGEKEYREDFAVFPFCFWEIPFHVLEVPESKRGVPFDERDAPFCFWEIPLLFSVFREKESENSAAKWESVLNE